MHLISSKRKHPIVTFQKPAPKCRTCDNIVIPRTEKSKLGFIRYQCYCKPCLAKKKKTYQRKTYPNRTYRKHLKSCCEFCGFIPAHTCQLDIDHIDKNRKNNKPSNLQTLCANCHRLKTFLNKDWLNSATSKKS